MNNSNKKTFLVFFLALLLVVVITALIYFFSPLNDQSELKTDAVNLEDGWVSFQDEQKTFTLNYPAEFEITPIESRYHFSNLNRVSAQNDWQKNHIHFWVDKYTQVDSRKFLEWLAQASEPSTDGQKIVALPQGLQFLPN